MLPALAKRNNGFVLRRFPEPSLLRFCDESEGRSLHGGRESLAVTKADAPKGDKEAFLNQIITWRETCCEPGALPSRLGQLRVRRAMGPSHGRETCCGCSLRDLFSGSWSRPKLMTNCGTSPRCRW
jgi:hypothetical protein